MYLLLVWIGATARDLLFLESYSLHIHKLKLKQ